MASEREPADLTSVPFDAPDDWNVSALGQLCQFVRDGDWIESKDQGGSDYRLLQISNIGVGRFVETGNFRWITSETFRRLNCTEVRLDDVLVARMPEPTGRAWHVRDLPRRAVTAVDVAIIRTNRQALNPRFLAYYLNSPACLGLINSLTVGTTRLRIRRADIERLGVPLPPLGEQHAIASILGALDDKIELNRKMSATLEAIARALFKSWFVDFDPVRAKAEGRDPGLPPEIAALFPDSFDDSGLGQIPRGWLMQSLSNVIDINPKRSLSGVAAAPYLDMASVPTRGNAVGKVIPRTVSSGTRFKCSDTLMARITPCLENGKTVFVDFLADGEVGWGSTEFIVLRPREPLPPEYAYLLARSDQFRAFAIGKMTGSSGRQRVPVDSLSAFNVALPPREVCRVFASVIQPLFRRISHASRESQTLSNLRDALLPKLISGEIRVRDAARLVEQSA